MVSQESRHAGGITVQTAWRQTHQQRAHQQQQQAAVCIQAAVHSHQLQAVTTACCVVQLRWRAYQAGRAGQAATKVQAAWRGLRQQAAYRAQRKAAVTIQLAVRAYLYVRRWDHLEARLPEVQVCSTPKGIGKHSSTNTLSTLHDDSNMSVDCLQSLQAVGFSVLQCHVVQRGMDSSLDTWSSVCF